MRVLVTGATGFVGGAVARQLARERHEVRALARSSADTTRLVAGGIDVVPGDVRDVDSVARALRGCSHVIHLAAAKSGPAALLHEVNVGGTENVMNAAHGAGIERVVFGSTLGVHGFISGQLLDESSPVRPNTPYRLSKWRGEVVARRAHEQAGTPLVVARISTVVGSGALGWVQLARGIAAGRMRLIGDGANSIDLVPIDDLVEGLIRCALTPSVDGRCYVLGSREPSTVAAFTTTIAAALDAPAPRAGSPSAPFRVAQHVAALVFRGTGYAWPFVHSREVLVADKRTTSERARAELGYEPSASVDEAVRAMVAAYLAEGRVPERGSA